MQDAIKIDPRDNVAVALRDLDAGAMIELPPLSVAVQQAGGCRPKFALQPIAPD